LLELIGLSKQYQGQGRWAVNDLNLKVRSGEIFGFLGPNGAGKTTTLKMIAGLLKPTKGQIIVNGYDLATSRLEAKSHIGFCPDTPLLYERLTGIEYLQFVGDVRKVDLKTRQERIEHYAKMFQLENALGNTIQSYSHGMKQKLSVMAALLAHPKLLILDEPMVGLDPRSSHLFKELMRKQCEQGSSVFFSTHILEVAEKLCDRVGIINEGRLIMVGTIDEIRQETKRGGSLESIFLELTETGEGNE
jgi:ABC-2 type transport system ATP-binding protein